jgi:class 3 adenylate cyclase/alpha-beta hydrolase superfamily lysophospholipase
LPLPEQRFTFLVFPVARVNAVGEMQPKTQYVRSGDVHIAYQVVGEGPLDIVYVPGWLSHVELAWELPDLVLGFERLASFSRLILFDKRGTGMSDRVPNDRLPTLEERMDDVRAVMDAVGSERAAVFGASEGGNMSILFAATHPQRTVALCTFGCYAKRIWSPDYPWAPTPEARELTYQAIERDWATGFDATAPSLDPERMAELVTYYRRCASPGAALALMKMNTQIDVRAVLPTIRVPTLIMHRIGDHDATIEEGRYLAEHIPGAHFVEFPGVDHSWWTQTRDGIIDEIEELLTGTKPAREGDRVLATVLFTDIVGATRGVVGRGDRPWLDLLRQHHTLVRKELVRFRGREINTIGDSFVAVFDGPARAIRCACNIRAAVTQLGIEVRAGLHTGEIELLGDDIGGIAVHIGARIAAAAQPSEVLVSSTVRDLVAGSAIAFVDRGARVLKGIPGERRLFAASAL